MRRTSGARWGAVAAGLVVVGAGAAGFFFKKGQEKPPGRTDDAGASPSRGLREPGAGGGPAPANSVSPGGLCRR